MAPQHGPVMLPTPASHVPGSNNQDAVAGRLRQLYRESQERASRIPTTATTTTTTSSSSTASPPPGCPMHASGGGASSSNSSSSGSSKTEINPLNNMPFNLNYSNDASSSSSSSAAAIKLSRERTISSIRRGQTSPAPGASPYDAPPSACPVKHDSASPSMWEYPSPEQFQAALARKNKAAPPETVETMVLVHNFLNEEGWKLVLDWEKSFGVDAEDVSLLRFQGRPGELSPRARWYGFLGSIWPSKYSAEPPFDRHDWIVGRPDGSTARYIIDYYGDDHADATDAAAAAAARRSDTQDDDSDQARFILDVRPAFDSFAAIKVRASRAFQEWSQQSS